jgi:predicted Holliday junction resolvase-like endonuclease
MDENYQIVSVILKSVILVLLVAVAVSAYSIAVSVKEIEKKVNENLTIIRTEKTRYEKKDKTEFREEMKEKGNFKNRINDFKKEKGE